MDEEYASKVKLRDAETTYIPLPHLDGQRRQGFEEAPPAMIRFPENQHKVWPAILFGLSCIGTAQMYNRQYEKGSLVFFVLGALGFIFIHYQAIMWGISVLLTLVMLFDAIQIARRLRRGELIGKWDWF